MTDQHRATPEQWAETEKWAQGDELDSSCILELRSRIESLEAAQLEQAESHRFCTDAIVRRVEALEAHDKEDASCWAMVRSGMHALRERVEALEAAPQDKLDRLIALDAADPTPDPAMPELRAASAEAQPAGGLVEIVANAIYNVPHDSAAEARAAIREVATWLDRFALHGSGEYAQAAKVLRQEVA